MTTLFLLPINYRLIRQKLLIRTIMAGSVVGLSALYFRELSWILSAMLGTCFGYLLFTQLIHSQCNLLKTKRKDLFLLGGVYRLAIYAIPISVSLVLKNYLNLYLLLVFLLAFQFQYVGMELSRNFKRYKRRSR